MKDFYQRHLPHFQPPDSAFSTVFRLAGSLPGSVIQMLHDEHEMIENSLAILPDGRDKRARIIESVPTYDSSAIGMSGIRTFARGLIRPVFDFLFPPLCFVCGQLLAAHERSVCSACLRSVRTVSPADLELQERLAKLASERTISGLVAVYYFEGGGALQSIIHQLKYSGMTSLGVMLGQRLGERVKEELAGEKIDGIIPMPLHRSKERERGYNQAEFICRGMAQVLGIPVDPKLITRKVHTKTQTKLNSEERKQNVAGAFAVSKAGRSRIKDATLLLVDDVVTTGATMQSCAGVLIEGGAKRVIACATALAT